MFHRHTISFKHALSGIGYAFRSQPNFRIHCAVGIVVCIAGWLLHLSPIEWAIIAFTITWVLLSEMINTAVESMVDLITNDYRKEAKIAKDVAAGAVFLGALASVVIAAIIFIPKL